MTPSTTWECAHFERWIIDGDFVSPPESALIVMFRPFLFVASGQYEEVVRLQETLCDLKRQFQNLQLKNVEKDQMRQSVLYRDAQKVRTDV